jgi:hypothetical protein
MSIQHFFHKTNSMEKGAPVLHKLYKFVQNLPKAYREELMRIIAEVNEQHLFFIKQNIDVPKQAPKSQNKDTKHRAQVKSGMGYTTNTLEFESWPDDSGSASSETYWTRNYQNLEDMELGFVNVNLNSQYKSFLKNTLAPLQASKALEKVEHGIPNNLSCVSPKQTIMPFTQSIERCDSEQIFIFLKSLQVFLVVDETNVEEDQIEKFFSRKSSRSGFVDLHNEEKNAQLSNIKHVQDQKETDLDSNDTNVDVPETAEDAKTQNFNQANGYSSAGLEERQEIKPDLSNRIQFVSKAAQTEQNDENITAIKYSQYGDNQTLLQDAKDEFVPATKNPLFPHVFAKNNNKCSPEQGFIVSHDIFASSFMPNCFATERANTSQTLQQDQACLANKVVVLQRELSLLVREFEAIAQDRDSKILELEFIRERENKTLEEHCVQQKMLIDKYGITRRSLTAAESKCDSLKADLTESKRNLEDAKRELFYAVCKNIDLKGRNDILLDTLCSLTAEYEGVKDAVEHLRACIRKDFIGCIQECSEANTED